MTYHRGPSRKIRRIVIELECGHQEIVSSGTLGAASLKTKGYRCCPQCWKPKAPKEKLEPLPLLDVAP